MCVFFFVYCFDTELVFWLGLLSLSPHSFVLQHFLAVTCYACQLSKLLTSSSAFVGALQSSAERWTADKSDGWSSSLWWLEILGWYLKIKWEMKVLTWRKYKFSFYIYLLFFVEWDDFSPNLRWLYEGVEWGSSEDFNTRSMFCFFLWHNKTLFLTSVDFVCAKWFDAIFNFNNFHFSCFIFTLLKIHWLWFQWKCH